MSVPANFGGELLVAPRVARPQVPGRRRREENPSAATVQHGAIVLGWPRQGIGREWGDADGQRKYWQRNGGKGMGTAKLLVFIPLPPFLCPIRFGERPQIQVGYEAGDSPPPPLTCKNPGRKAGQNRGRRAQEAEGGTLADSNFFRAPGAFGQKKVRAS
ncbi:hypothetical protein LBMAG56_48950 [Verrucomicrobiota bacterium]|nr:hypothetical protein LBMAG56_48950 [Verrucomicrobiota bacterium]